MYKIADLISALEDNIYSPAYDYVIPCELTGKIEDNYKVWSHRAINTYYPVAEKWASEYDGEHYIQQAIEEKILLSKDNRIESLACAQYCFYMEQFHSEDKEIRELFVYRYLYEKGVAEFSYEQLERIDEITSNNRITTWAEILDLIDKI